VGRLNQGDQLLSLRVVVVITIRRAMNREEKQRRQQINKTIQANKKSP
jgi:hypothetical protein